MSDFRAQLEKAYKEKVEGNLIKVARATAFHTFSQLVENTPVDTGRAKSNWHIETNTINAQIVEPGHTEDPNAKTMSVKVNDTIYISNNLPYIRRLNEGYSKQAPALFVEAAAQVGTLRGKEILK